MAEQFDMFSKQAPRDHVVTRSTAKSSETDKYAIPLSEEDMVRHLSETGRYRILTKLVPRAIVPFARPAYPLKGIILDTETTGLNARKDEIIEIGVIAFTVSGKLTPSGVVRAFACNSDIRFTNCELLCLRLALEPETSI